MYYLRVPQISVIVTNYNYSGYLGRCLRSLLDQTADKEQYEIIVVDDGSTDNSREVINIFRTQVSPIFLESNMGLSHSANYGIRSAKGRYITRVDSDDFVHPRFIETLLLGFECFADCYEAVSVDYVEVDEVGHNLGIQSQELAPIACGIAFKSEVFEIMGFYDERLKVYEEVDFKNRFDSEGFMIKHLNLPLYRYVKHGNSLTSRKIIL